MSSNLQARARVCFLYIAQSHQVLHSITAAVEMARGRPDIAVDVAATSREVLDYARLQVERLGGAPITWRLLGPGWLRTMARADGVPPKMPMLVANSLALAKYDIVVAPERTTAALRFLGGGAPRLVYTQHGAGDRAGPFEPRLRQFDLVFAAGEKQRDRMVVEGLVRPDCCAVVGYPKFDLVERLNTPAPKLFPRERPVVIYNPHFDPRLSSWPRWGLEILRQFAAQDQFNLIFAPHLRLFESRPPQDVAELAPFLDHPNIHMDLGATTCAIDMTYTRMADVYLGDASSQIYEFLYKLRPCVFLNAHDAAWEDDESYRHWRFGPVLDAVTALPARIAEAQAGHGDYIEAQRESFRYTFDLEGPPSSVRAANAIAGLLTRDTTERQGVSAAA